MAIEEAEVISHWTGDGSNSNPYRPALEDACRLAGAGNWEMPDDADFDPSINNILIVKLTADSDDMDVFEASENYRVVWREQKDRLEDVNLDVLMTDNDVVKLGDFLRDVTGLTNAQIAALFDKSVAQMVAFIKTKTRAQVVALLKAKWKRLV